MDDWLEGRGAVPSRFLLREGEVPRCVRGEELSEGEEDPLKAAFLCIASSQEWTGRLQRRGDKSLSSGVAGRWYGRFGHWHLDGGG